MNKERLFRLAISLDDQAPSTVDKYICRLVESILFFSDENGLSVIEICKAIEQEFGLQFDINETTRAIKQKAKNNIIMKNGILSLNVKRRDNLKNQTNMSEVLKNFIRKYNEQKNVQLEESDFYDLFIKFLYHCFNFNKNHLLNLLGRDNNEYSQNFNGSNDEIDKINGFIKWDNDEKNIFLYSIISFSYEYCMLTTKKDSLLNKKMFSGKRLFLDANLIFRIAGINKDERRFIVSNFINKCKEVGIELIYTSETLAEIYRVINSQLSNIKSITQNQNPMDKETIESLYGDLEISDFYSIYYAWSREREYGKISDRMIR